MLGMHQDIQEMVYKEVKEVCGDSDREITKHDIAKLPYLDRVIKETLRLFPIANIIPRESLDDVQMGSRILPKGMTCFLNLIEYHRDPRRWPDPFKFDPDRFLPEENAKRHPFTFIPFTAGPRNCIGYKYGTRNVIMTMAQIIRAYKFSTKFKTVDELRFEMAVLTRLVNGHLVQIEKRT